MQNESYLQIIRLLTEKSVKKIILYTFLCCLDIYLINLICDIS